jgi:hypothetical protein
MLTRGKSCEMLNGYHSFRGVQCLHLKVKQLFVCLTLKMETLVSLKSQ